VHKIGALLLLILLIIILVFIGLKDKQPDTTAIPVEDTTEIFMTKDAQSEQNQRFKLQKKQKVVDDLNKVNMSTQDINIPEPDKTPSVFTLINTIDKSHQITVSNQQVIFDNIKKPIVIVNLFATWCPPCIGEIAYLNDLQKKYKTDLFIAGILTHDDIDQPALETFMAEQQIDYFISYTPYNDTFASLLARILHLPENFSIPLTVMYVEGEYFTHYEGSVPVEMIEYDIEQAKKQLKSR